MKTLSRNCQKIIIFLGLHPEEKFFNKEIAAKAGVSAGGAHNALKQLAQEKIVEAEKKGNMKFYQIVADNPKVKQLKITAVVDQLSGLVNAIKSHSQKIILFGSSARGEQTATSDIDLFIETDNKEEVNKIIKKIDAPIDDYNFSYPSDLKRIMDIASIPHKILWGDRCKCNHNFKLEWQR